MEDTDGCGEGRRMRELAAVAGIKSMTGKISLAQRLGIFSSVPIERDEYVYGNKDRLIRNE